MISKKFNWSIYFIITLLSGMILLGARVVYLLLTNQVKDESNTDLPLILIYFMVCAISVVIFSYLCTVICYLIQIFKYKQRALYINEQGIHNTLICINLLAFFFVGKIAYIPWSAVSYFEKEELYIRVKTKDIKASPIGKLLVFVLGYNFSARMIKPKFSEDEKMTIEQYINAYSRSTP